MFQSEHLQFWLILSTANICHHYAGFGANGNNGEWQASPCLLFINNWMLCGKTHCNDCVRETSLSYCCRWLNSLTFLCADVLLGICCFSNFFATLFCVSGTSAFTLSGTLTACSFFWAAVALLSSFVLALAALWASWNNHTLSQSSVLLPGLAKCIVSTDYTEHVYFQTMELYKKALEYL